VREQFGGWGPGEGVLLDGFVVGVEGGFEEEDGGNASGPNPWDYHDRRKKVPPELTVVVPEASCPPVLHLGAALYYRLPGSQIQYSFP